MMRLPGPRVAVAITCAAVLLPCAIWYILGARQLDSLVGELREGARREAKTTARQMATRLALQLEDLSNAEAERPHLDYWTEYLSRGHRCGKLKVRRSPLASIAPPHVVQFHFLVDDEGQITSPRPDMDLSGLTLPVSDDLGLAQPQYFKPEIASVIPSAIRSRYLQSRDSEEPEDAGPEHLVASDDTNSVGDFKWYTGRWHGQPTLLAIRPVRVGDREYNQGFSVASGMLSDLIFDGGFPARLETDVAPTATSALLPLAGVKWLVAVDPTPAMKTAGVQEATLRRQFHYSYFGGLFGALLAGSCVLGLVWHSGRLARERSRFAAAAAHELRTPLAGIRLHGEMLAGSLGNPARIERYAQRITDEAERLGRVVANVVNYTRDDQRRLTLDLREGDITDTLHRCLAMVEPLISESGATLQVQIAADLPLIKFDPDAITQIVLNLVDNAEKYTRKATDRRIEIDAHEQGSGAIELIVADHGPGVAQSMRPRLFRPFANADTEAKHAGLGLGLSVVETLMRAQGGSVSYRDTPGGGATFVVVLAG